MIGIAAALALLWSSATAAAPPAAQPSSGPAVDGVYHCLAARIDGQAAPCPADLILSVLGSYSMGRHGGTFIVYGNAVRLSGLGAANLAGPDRLSFSWLIDGHQLDAEYARMGGPPAASQEASSPAVPVEVSVRFAVAAPDVLTSHIEAVLLEPEDGSAPLGAPASVDRAGAVLASFPSVPVGRVYTVAASSDNSLRNVGRLDLRGITQGVRFEATVK